MTQQDTELTALVNAFDRPEQLETARNLLIAAGIDGERITTVARPDTAASRAATKWTRGEIAKDGTAAVTGAMMATYVGLPILGPFVPAATIAGGLIGWLIGAGLPRGKAEEYGERLQFSVFVCDLSRAELIHARAQVEKQMNLHEDSVVIVDLGETDTARFTFVGRRRPLPVNEARIL